MLLVMRLPLGLFKSLAPLALLASLVLLVAVMVPGVGATINGARRWIAVGPLTLQPSELAKLGAAGNGRRAAVGEEDRAADIRRAGEADRLPDRPRVPARAGRARPRLGDRDRAHGRRDAARRGRAGSAARRDHGRRAVLGGIAIWLEPYRRERLSRSSTRRRTRAAAPTRSCRASSASRSGGPGGVGLGESIQKVYYVPEAHTDMIFAIIGEELGLAGALVSWPASPRSPGPAT